MSSESLKTKKAEALQDKQNGRDHRELRIDKVGVRGRRFPIRSATRRRKLQNTIATIGMYRGPAQGIQGTHMSRFIEVLNAHGNVVHVENITDILHAMQAKLKRQRPIWKWSSPSSWSKKPRSAGMEGVMDYTARFDAPPSARKLISSLTSRSASPRSAPAPRPSANTAPTTSAASYRANAFRHRHLDRRPHRARRELRQFGASTPCSNARTKKPLPNAPMKIPSSWKTWCAASRSN